MSCSPKEFVMRGDCYFVHSTTVPDSFCTMACLSLHSHRAEVLRQPARLAQRHLCHRVAQRTAEQLAVTNRIHTRQHVGKATMADRVTAVKDAMA